MTRISGLELTRYVRKSTFCPMKKIITFGILALALVFSGCTMKSRIVLDTDGSGDSAISMELSPVLYDYLMTLQESVADPSVGVQPLFNEAAVFEAFSATPSVSLTSVTIPNPQSLEILFRFDDLEAVFDEGKQVQVDKVFTLSKQGNQKTLRFFLSAENFSSIMSLVPMEDTTMIDALGPQPEFETSEEDYIIMIDYLLEDVAEGRNVEEILKNSFIDLTLEVKGRIISHQGGEKSGRQIEYHIPLLKVLTLNDPLEYEIVFE